MDGRIPSRLLLRTRIYLALNRLFGTPVRVVPGAYTRTATIYAARTAPFLEDIRWCVAEDARVLIVGCGEGDEIPWFAERAACVVAIDVSGAVLEVARRRAAPFANVSCDLVDGAVLPHGDGSFDLVFMHNACEHIIELEASFREYRRVLRPGGRIINSFSPLFYSPYGAHLQDALKIPWGHLLFGCRTVVEVRNQFYPGVATATSWEELGLNRLTEARYRSLVHSLGFEVERHEVRTSRGLPLVGSIPLLRNLFILEVVSILRKPS